MTTKIWEDKQKKTKLSTNKNRKIAESINEIKIVSYPELSAGKTDYVDNPDIPWIQSPRSKDQSGGLAVALVHEMRNPLAVISLTAELLYDKIEKDKDLTIYVEAILKSAARINDLTFKLLTVPQFTSLTEHTCSIEEIFDEVLEIVADRIRLKSISVSKDFNAAGFVITFDKSKLKIALTNIVTNAIEAMPSVSGILRLAIQENNGKYSVRIEDNGCGISKENLLLIFEKGFTNKPNGLGCGLSITNNFLQANNITMKVKSQEGKGTIFLLLFN